METSEIVRYWILLIVFSNILVLSILMLWTGRFPPPMSNRKANPLLSTALHVIGMTGTLIYGTQDLLALTLQKLTGQ